jgi:hypothetical protein
VAPAVLFVVLYSLTTTAHIYQAWRYKKSFYWVLIMGGCWEIIGMSTRIATILDYSKPVNDTSFLFILLAPLWINAFVYMTLGKLVHMYMPDKQLAGVKAQRLGMYFVLLDIRLVGLLTSDYLSSLKNSSFFVQLGGGIIALENNPNRIRYGSHIYTAGTSIQEAVILAFVVLSIIFSNRLKKEDIKRDTSPAKKLMVVLYIALALITVSSLEVI